MNNCKPTAMVDQRTYNRILQHAKKLGVPVERVAIEALNEYVDQWDDGDSTPEPQNRNVIPFPMAPASV